MKGISPIVAVVLLIAIAVIAAVGLYFWVGGLATQQPTTAKPGVISATCAGGTILVSNIGTTAIVDTTTAQNLTHTASGTVAKNGTGGNYCEDGTIASGGTCVYASGQGTLSGISGTIYAPSIGAAKFYC